MIFLPSNDSAKIVILERTCTTTVNMNKANSIGSLELDKADLPIVIGHS